MSGKKKKNRDTRKKKQQADRRRYEQRQRLDPESASRSQSGNSGTSGRGALLAALAAVVVIGAGFLFLTSGGDDESVEQAAAPRFGDLPPESFDLFEGGEATFEDFGGKPVVLNFFASWCPACVAELPEFERVHRDVGEEVTFIGMANNDDRDNALDLAASTELSFTLVDDPTGGFFTELGLTAMPSTVFITPDGRVHERFGGVLNEASLRQKIAELQAAS